MKEEPAPVTGTDPNSTAQPMTTNQMQPMGMMPGMMPAAPGMYGAPGMMPAAPGMYGTPGMMPMPGMMPYQNFLYCEDPMKELALSTGALIRQEVEMYEVVSGCETQNRYHVLLQSKMGLKMAFKCIESSGCCSRCCCPNDCRGLKMTITHMASSAEVVTDISKIFVRAEKPCCAGFLCCCRPHMDIRLEENNKYIGGVREPFTCCDRDVETYDENHNTNYRIIGDCCQYGFCCGASAEKMIEIEFRIMKNGQQVGAIKKANMSIGEYLTKADTYKVAFPLDATPESKMLLICAALLIDYQNFENDSTPKKIRKEQGM